VTSSVAEARPWGRLTDHVELGVVSARFGRDLLEEVLNRTDRREKRSRRLPAHVMIRYVIAMGLFASESYDEVMRRLVGNLRKLGSWNGDWQVPAKSGSGPKASAYPKLHVAALTECGSHAVVGAVLSGCRTGERTLAADLTGTLGPGMLVMADAGLYSYELFTAFAATGADLAWRIGASVSVGHLRWLADGSYQALIYAPRLSAARRARLVEQAHAGQDIPADLARLVRVAEYTVPDRNPNGELIAVITTVTDPHDLSVLDLAQAYHQRWEEESALDEIKTDLRGRGEVLRSKTPDLVEQQLWGLLLAHYAIRALLLDAADPAGYDPDRMSFIKRLRVVRRQVTDQAAITP
jgi:Insertion element 4 transposase N-terminal/Transposase DDE domain